MSNWWISGRRNARSSRHSLFWRWRLLCRERLAGERGKFQEAAVAFAKRNVVLREISDERALQDHLKSEINKAIRPELDKLKDALRGNDIDVVLGAMNMKVRITCSGNDRSRGLRSNRCGCCH